MAAISVPSKIQLRSELLVYGYCRNCAKLVLSAIYSIPGLVKNTILLYYQETEYFEFVGPAIHLSEDKKTMEGGTSGKWNFLNLGAALIPLNEESEGVYEWKIRVTKYQGNICLGLCGDVEKLEEMKQDSNTWCGHGTGGIRSDYYYGFGNGNYTIKGLQWTPSHQRDVWQKNDLIEIQLDCNNKKITFTRNGGTQIKHENIHYGKDVKYRLVVCVVFGSVTIEDFR